MPPRLDWASISCGDSSSPIFPERKLQTQFSVVRFFRRFISGRERCRDDNHLHSSPAVVETPVVGRDGEGNVSGMVKCMGATAPLLPLDHVHGSSCCSPCPHSNIQRNLSVVVLLTGHGPPTFDFVQQVSALHVDFFGMSVRRFSGFSTSDQLHTDHVHSLQAKHSVCGKPSRHHRREICRAYEAVLPMRNSPSDQHWRQQLEETGSIAFSGVACLCVALLRTPKQKKVPLCPSLPPAFCDFLGSSCSPSGEQLPRWPLIITTFVSKPRGMVLVNLFPHTILEGQG